jgi:hypothetical protein
MSSTPASQTLFRFVSVRNPQLTHESGKDKRFIFRTDAVKNQAATINVFDAAIAQAGNGTKIALLIAEAPAYKLSTAYLENELVIETLVGQAFYSFATWLARNRDAFLNTELLVKAQEAGAVLNLAKSTRLWNNLFYQVVTQESFYVKEAIIQVLTANHVIQNLDNDIASKGVANNKAHVKSTLVLPKELFLEESTLSTGLGNRISGKPNAAVTKKQLSSNLRKKQIATRAKYYNDLYEEVKSEIKQIETQYQKEYQIAYENAYKIYEASIKPIKDNYRAQLEAERKRWVGENKKSNSNINSNTVQVEVTDSLNHPDLIPEPDFSIFEFNFQSKIDYLNAGLPKSHIKLLNNLKSNFNAASNNLIAGDIIVANSVETIFENLEYTIRKNNDAIITNTVIESDGILAIGGVNIPLNNNSNRLSISENFTATTASLYNATELIIRILFESWDLNIANANYSVYDMNGNLCQSDNSFNILNVDYYSIFSSQNLLQITPQIQNGFVLKGSFTLADGDVYHFDLPLVTDYNNVLDPITGLYNMLGYGSMSKDTLPPPTGGGGGTTTDTVFKPTGFGVKQLGIADYKKVEQSVHCYVEGEVAHIENIMAREYREKSTRRLRRSENTTTTSSESEREHLNDTTSTDRYEMQSEVAKVMQQSRDFSANASVTGTKFGITLSAGAN